MKKVLVGIALVYILLACTNAADDNKPGNANKANNVDGSVIGSDNPNPDLIPDTTGADNKTDSTKNK